MLNCSLYELRGSARGKYNWQVGVTTSLLSFQQINDYLNYWK